MFGSLAMCENHRGAPSRTRNLFNRMSLSARPTAVVFDLDGLMFNTEELYQEVGTELLRRRGCEFTPALLDKMMGRPGHIALQCMIDEHALSDTVVELQRESDVIFHAILDTRLAPMPGLMPLLAALEERQIPKAIATSSRRSFLTTVLARFQLEPRFAFTITAEDVTHGKPDPEIYLTASRRMQRAPAEVLVLEDSHNGCRAAITAGTFAVAVPGGHSHRHDFTGAQFIAESLADPRIYRTLGLDSPQR
jgi:HAD superfamily hydrolase (TIGR01509 family)